MFGSYRWTDQRLRKGHWSQGGRLNTNCEQNIAPLQMDAINDKFAEARDEIDYANEDAESTYFDESYKSAQAATDEVRRCQGACSLRSLRSSRGAHRPIPGRCSAVWYRT